MKKLSISLMSLLVLGAIGCAEEPEVVVTETAPVTETEMAVVDPVLGDDDWWIYTEWDVDANQQITRSEFDTRLESGFAEWDIDSDGVLGPDETAGAFWGFFDRNDDNLIASTEWNAGVERWSFDDIDWGTWDTWDADADAELTETEWRRGWNDTIWASWDPDGDGFVGRDELADTFWDFFDANDDDIIDAGEWESQG